MDCNTFPVSRGSSFAAILVLSIAGGVSTGRAEEPLPDTVEFNRHIRPILSDACYHCHGPDRAKRKANLRFDTSEGVFADRDGYRVIVPGDPASSELIRRISASERSRRMPPASSGRALSARQAELIRRWIAQGAKWQKHWSLIPPVRPAPPSQAVSADTRPAREWVRNPIDAFIVARLGGEGLQLAPEAERSTLLRRVTLDLTGLPPMPDEVDAFLADVSPNAYERVVDRLLGSPRYGERMVLEWLDAARYADSNGYQADLTRTMWPWRDAVVEALNRNVPFDRFTIEQVAGDLLPNATVAQKVASGFHRNHMLNGEGGRIAEESRVDYVVDRVDTTATVWLGLTLGCSRCHDHKYDPFTQKDYYRLFAYFNSVAETGAVDRGGNAAPVLRMPTREQEERIAALTRDIQATERGLKIAADEFRPGPPEWQRLAGATLARAPAPVAAVVNLPDRYLAKVLPVQTKLADQRRALDAANRSVLQTMVMEDQPQPRETFVLLRGAYNKPGEKVGPGTPGTLPPVPAAAPPNRLGLARWLVDPANPLTARVAVNRAWQQFFGAGIVKTTEDFGVQGDAPSHPELLDWLATEFVHSGWDVKSLHRLIVTSATYRQSSRTTPDLLERDPDNRLLARGPRFRLSSLVLRDQALAVSGLLVERLGGTPVRPYQPPGVWEEMTFGKIKYQPDSGPNLYRRSLYTFWRRTVGPTDLFDTPARQTCTVRQGRTNTPLQALILWNDVTYVEAARKLAECVMRQAHTPAERITLAFRCALARSPTMAERAILQQSHERLLKQYRADPGAGLKLVGIGESPRDPSLEVAELAAYTGLANLILNLDEVVTKE